MYIPKALYLWLVLSAIIVIYDAAFIILRPATLKGGSLYHIYWPYEAYLEFDTLYANMNDSFVVIQSWLNIVEAVFLMLGVGLSISSSHSQKLVGAFLTIITSAFVFWKTVIFLLYDKDFTTPQVASFSVKAIFCYVLPSSLWIIFPLISMWIISKNLIKRMIHLNSTEKPKKQ